jgi:hypothetical protein
MGCVLSEVCMLIKVNQHFTSLNFITLSSLRIDEVHMIKVLKVNNEFSFPNRMM